jgi:hypothetical protein
MKQSREVFASEIHIFSNCILCSMRITLAMKCIYCRYKSVVAMGNQLQIKLHRITIIFLYFVTYTSYKTFKIKIICFSETCV